MVARFKSPVTKIVLAGLFVGGAVMAFLHFTVRATRLLTPYLWVTRTTSQTTSIFSSLKTVKLSSHRHTHFSLGSKKPLLTGFTVGAGGVGGVFAPSLFGGALLGFVFALGVNMVFGEGTIPVGNAVLVGLGGMMSGVLHAPLTAIFLATEISGGYGLFVPLMLSSALSYVIAKKLAKYSIYTKELAARGELLTHDKDKCSYLMRP